MTDALLSSEIGATLLAVTGLLGLVLLTRRAVSKRFGPHIAYALWALPVLRLLTPNLSVPDNWLLILPWRDVVAQETRPVVDASALPFLATPSQEIAAQPTLIDAMLSALPTLLMVAWLVGTGIGAAVIISRQISFRRKVYRDSASPCANLQTQIDRAARLSRLRKSPTVRIASNNNGPLVFGLFRPTILMPADVMTGFNADQRHYALLHEMAHVKRGDLWTATLMAALRLLNWPNPLFHLAWPRFRADQEAACDATVLRLTGEAARSDYAETLLHAATLSGRANPATGAGLTLSLHHPLKERLMTLGTPTSKRGAGRWALAGLLLSGATISAPISFADDPNPPASVTVVKGHIDIESATQDGKTVFLTVNRNGDSQSMTAEELMREFNIDLGDVSSSSEPGLAALANSEYGHEVRRVFVRNRFNSEDGSYEVNDVDGVKKAYRIEADGTKTEISFDEVEGMSAMPVQIDQLGESGIRVFRTDSEFIGEGQNAGATRTLRFESTQAASNAETAGARLYAAQSLLDSTNDMLTELREDADGTVAGDLRDAERELETALKALEKAREAVRKSNER